MQTAPLLLKQKNLGLVAWSPLEEEPFLLARGSLVELPEESETVEDIEILRLDPLSISESGGSRSLQSLGSLETGMTLNCLDWSPGFGEQSKGLLSGAFGDGSLVLLDAARLIESNNEEQESSEDHAAILSSFTLYESQEFYCMEYNRFRPSLLATGGSDVYVVNFEQSLEEPEVFSPYPANNSPLNGAKVTSIGWNKNKGVQHILASAAENGKISIFDLKLKKSIFTLSDQKENVFGRNVSIQWNEAIATQLAIAFDDEASGVQIWDLRNSRAPVKILDRDIVRRVHSLDWANRQTMLLSDFEGNVLSYNTHTGVVETFYSAQSSEENKKTDQGIDLGAGTSNNPADVFNNLGNENAADVFSNLVNNQDNLGGEGNRTLYAKSIPEIGNAFYMVTAKGDLTASFRDRKTVSSLASRFCGTASHVGWRKGLFAAENIAVVTSDVTLENCLNEDFTNESTGVVAVELGGLKATQDLKLTEDEKKVEKRITALAEVWKSANVGQVPNDVKEALVSRGMDRLILELVEKLGSDWKSKMPVLQIDPEKTARDTEKVTGYKYSKENEEETPSKQGEENRAETGVCAFADISENEAEDFFSQLAKKPEPTAQKNALGSQRQNGVEQVEGFDEVGEHEMEVQETLINKDWTRGLEALIKQNILVNNYEGAIDCAIKANRHFEGFLIAYSHPRDSQALIQKTLEKIAQRHNEDFVHSFFKPLFKKDFRGIIEKYNVEQWREALAFIVYNLEGSPEQSECLDLLRKRVAEAVKNGRAQAHTANLAEMTSRSERLTQRRETVSQRAVLAPETLSYLDLFQNDISATVTTLIDRLSPLEPDSFNETLDSLEYLLFLKGYQNFDVSKPELQKSVDQVARLLILLNQARVAYFLLESLGDSNNFEVQKLKNSIWKAYNSELVKDFTAPQPQVEMVWFPRKSIPKPQAQAAQNTQVNTKKNSMSKPKGRFNKKQKPFSRPGNVRPKVPNASSNLGQNKIFGNWNSAQPKPMNPGFPQPPSKPNVKKPMTRAFPAPPSRNSGVVSTNSPFGQVNNPSMTAPRPVRKPITRPKKPKGRVNPPMPPARNVPVKPPQSSNIVNPVGVSQPAKLAPKHKPKKPIRKKPQVSRPAPPPVTRPTPPIQNPQNTGIQYKINL